MRARLFLRSFRDKVTIRGGGVDREGLFLLQPHPLPLSAGEGRNIQSGKEQNNPLRLISLPLAEANGNELRFRIKIKIRSGGSGQSS